MTCRGILGRAAAFICAHLVLFVAQASGQVQFPNAVYALAINPVNTSTLYAATDNGVLRTTNGGATWEPANNGLPSGRVTAVAIDPSNPSVVYVGTQGVYKSTNGGSTWVRTGNGIPSTSLGVAALAIDPSNPANLYAGLFAAGGFGLVRSTDGGASWITATNAILPKTTFDGLAFDPTNSSTVYAASMKGGVFRSTDKGANWTAANEGLPSLRVTALVIGPSNASTLYIRVRDSGVFKSTNAGTTWAPANNGIPANVDLVGYASALVIDPKNSSILYTGTFTGGVFKTANGGASWTPMNNGFPSGTGGSLAIDPKDSSVLYAGTTDGRVFKSIDAGATWEDPQGSGTCVQSLSPGGQVFPPEGGTASINVTAPAGCAWSATSTLDWISFVGARNGSGNGGISYQVAANNGAGRSIAIIIGGIPVAIEQQAATIAGLNFAGAMPHIAAQNVWRTTFTVVNKAASAATARLRMFGDPSGTLTLPLVLPQVSATPLLASSLDRTIAGNALLVLNSGGPQTPPTLEGSAQLFGTGAVDGFAIFHLIPGSQEAVVPLETRNAGSYLLAFDNTGGVVLGVAVQNVSSLAAPIPVVIRDDAGVVISAPGTTLAMEANGHTSFVLSTQYPFTANQRGTVEFATPSGGQISVLGIRTTPLVTSTGTNTFALTTIPALANIGTSGGSIAHIATGNGWQTTFVLVNTGTQAHQATLKFFATGTGAALSIPLAFPQAGAGSSTVANSVTRTLAAGATLVVRSAAPASDPAPTIGAAQLTTDGNVGGFVIFRYNTNGQEAVVPLENRTANGYLIAFDNTAGTVTGIAVNNVSAQPVSVPVIVRDDAGNQIDSDRLTLPANAHSSFTLGGDKFLTTAGKRGTIEFVSGQIGALGIRVSSTFTFTTLPALVK